MRPCGALPGAFRPQGAFGVSQRGGRAWRLGRSAERRSPAGLQSGRVEIHYRDLDHVEHWIARTQEGHYEVDGLAGVVGFPTYTLAAEASLGRVLAGSLGLQIAYPAVLAEKASTQWREHARSRAQEG